MCSDMEYNWNRLCTFYWGGVVEACSFYRAACKVTMFSAWRSLCRHPAVLSPRLCLPAVLEMALCSCINGYCNRWTE